MHGLEQRMRSDVVVRVEWAYDVWGADYRAIEGE